jgi:hypothetical protein
MTAYAQVRQDTVHRTCFVQTQKTIRVPEILRHKKDPTVSRDIAPGILVLVKGNQSSFWTQLLQDGAAMAPSPESAIHINPVRANGEAFHGLLQ